MDWLRKYRVDICHSTRSVRLHDSQGLFLTSKPFQGDISSTPFPVKLVGSCLLQPFQQRQVKAFVPFLSGASVYFLPRAQLQINKTARIPEALLNVANYITSLTIYNDSAQVCHLAKGTLLGKVSLIDPSTSINSVSFSTGDSHVADVVSPSLDTLSDSLRTIISSAVQHLSDDDQRVTMTSLLTKYSSLLDVSNSTLANTSMNHAIRTTDHLPVTTKPYPQSIRQRVEMQDHVHKMLRAKQIRPSTSPWSSPALLVAKPDGSTRFVVDFRKLNQITIKDEYPLPTIEDTINQLAGYSWFTKLDLKSGYLQIPLREVDKQKTAFKTKDGLFEFNVLPPGLKNAPPSFQRIMDSILAHGRSSFCLVYLDDIIIFSKTFAEHLVHVEHVFQSLHLYRFQLNPNKCAFFLRAMDYLGHHITSNGLSPLTEKIDAILHLPMPRTLKEANHFIGAIGWYRKFIRNFASIASPIHAVTNKSRDRRRDFHWGSEQMESFNQLRSILTSKPLVLDFPDASSPLILSSDASDIGVGAVLRQETPGGLKILYYFSQVLNPAQRKYATIEREALAIGLAITKLRPYLLGRPFCIETDHCPLCNFHRRPSRNRRVDWWSIALSEFDITEVKFKKGTLNCDCDLLSRYPLDYERLQDLPSSVNVITRAQARKRNTVQQDSSSSLSQKSVVVTTQTSGPLAPNSSTPAKRSPLDIHRIRAEQLLDENIQKITMQQRLHPTDKFVIHDDILYKVLHNRSSAIHVPFLPQSLIREVLFAFHDHPSAGHFGRDRTFAKLKTRCYWPNMYETIRSYIKSCVACGKYHINRQKPPGHLQPIPPPQGIFDLVGIDFWGPTPESSASGNRYVIVLTDYLTKYVIAKAVPRNTAMVTAEFLLDVSLTFGVPKHILTDNGSHFRNELMNSLTSVLGCQQVFITPYHAQANGVVERWNATMRPKSNALHDKNLNNWDTHLAGIVGAYNTGLHATTGFSPSYLMFGREISLPFDSARPVVSISKPSDYLTYLAHHRQLVLQAARDNIRRNQGITKARYDKNRSNPNYQVGDLVLIRQHRPHGKTDPSYLGPYRVTKCISPLTYIVTNDEDTREIQVHVSDIHPIFHSV